MNIRGIIYIYTSPSNKCYVGQSINERDRRYSFTNIKERYAGKKFENARMKYKPENFLYEILFEEWFDTAEEAKEVLDKLEIEYIEKYDSFNNGYNGNLGGFSNVGYRHTKEQIEKFSGLNSPNSKQLVVFDLYANPIKAYMSIKEASDDLKIDPKVLNSVPKTYYKSYIARFITLEEYYYFIDNEITLEPEHTDKLRYIAQININKDEIVNCFITAQEAAEANGLKRGTSITNVLNGYKPTAAGHYWRRINYEEYIEWKELL